MIELNEQRGVYLIIRSHIFPCAAGCLKVFSFNFHMKTLLMFRDMLFILFILVSNFITAQKNDRPNIIYIMADDLGYADLSCYGRKDYQTPNLDKLCTQGMKFMNAYASAPVCTPTRVAFYTGRYPARTKVGLYEPLADGHEDSLVGFSSKDPSIARLLKK